MSSCTNLDPIINVHYPGQWLILQNRSIDWLLREGGFVALCCFYIWARADGSLWTARMSKVITATQWRLKSGKVKAAKRRHLRGFTAPLCLWSRSGSIHWLPALKRGVINGSPMKGFQLELYLDDKCLWLREWKLLTSIKYHSCLLSPILFEKWGNIRLKADL